MTAPYMTVSGGMPVGVLRHWALPMLGVLVIAGSAAWIFFHAACG